MTMDLSVNVVGITTQDSDQYVQDVESNMSNELEVKPGETLDEYVNRNVQQAREYVARGYDYNGKKIWNSDSYIRAVEFNAMQRYEGARV